MDAPLILTLALDPESQAFFNALRKAHFPPERNYLDAHVTLFHALPGAHLSEIADALAAVTSATSTLTLEVTVLRFLGRGVAYSLNSEKLNQLHSSLQDRWFNWLTPQDQQKRAPHITVQNKVPPEEARKLKECLEADFSAFQITGKGLLLWAYLDGPWRLLASFPFSR